MAKLTAIPTVKDDKPKEVDDNWLGYCEDWTTLRDWLSSVPQESLWLCDGIVPDAGLTYITGHSKRCKKTFFSDLLSLCVASGKSVDIIKPVRKGKVIAIHEEGPRNSIKGRFECYMREYGFPEETLDNVIFRHLARVDLLDSMWQQSILALVKKHRPALMIWDPLTKMHTADEKDAQEMGRIVRFVGTINSYGCALVINAHLNKGEGEDDSRDIDTQMRGSSVFINSYDCHVAFRNYNPKNDKEPFQLTIRSKVAEQVDYRIKWNIVESASKDGSLEKAEFEILPAEESDVDNVESGGSSRGSNTDYYISEYIEVLPNSGPHTASELSKHWFCNISEAKDVASLGVRLGLMRKKGRSWICV